ncbi:hypothetical protein B484DRAFT_173128 [Ochromonadaceae sp. CCMP2298]|nr:hypothetical protein B484DRAFT_173128 [Ochromonadaceae sp. CCMP2298]
MSRADIRTAAARENLYKKLRSEVHPDKHAAADKASASLVFTDLANFYEQCATCDFNAKRRGVTPEKEAAHSSKRSRPTLPYKLNVEEQWPTVMEHLKDWGNEFMKDPKKWCFSARGHIVHHALTGRLAGAAYHTDYPFQKLPAGNDVESIKEELLLHGPVLSTSFKPSGAVTAEYGLNTTTPSNAIILGWRQVKDKGEVWLVRPTPQAEVVEIPVDSCSLTDDVQIPVTDLGTYRWQLQADFPFLERDFSGETDWMTLSEYNTTLHVVNYLTLLMNLSKGKDLDIGEVLSTKRQIEICPKGLMAQSRRAEIVGLICTADGSWTLRTKFV